MTPAYADVSASGLRFNLVTGPVDLDQLDPISRTVMSVELGDEGLQIEIGILGASHFLSLATPGGGVFLTEVFVCKEIDSDAQRHYFGPLGPGGSIQTISHIHPGTGLVYKFRAWTEKWSIPTLQTMRELEQSIGKPFANKKGLSYEFPSPAGFAQTEQKPVTLVLLTTARGVSVTVRTAHSYPNDGVVVFTETKLEMRGGAE